MCRRDTPFYLLQRDITACQFGFRGHHNCVPTANVIVPVTPILGDTTESHPPSARLGQCRYYVCVTPAHSRTGTESTRVRPLRVSSLFRRHGKPLRCVLMRLSPLHRAGVRVRACAQCERVGKGRRHTLSVLHVPGTPTGTPPPPLRSSSLEPLLDCCA